MNSLRGESRPGVMLTPPKNVFPQSDLGSMVTTDFIYDICHLCTRSRTDRIKAISRGSLTGGAGKPVITISETVAGSISAPVPSVS